MSERKVTTPNALIERLDQIRAELADLSVDQNEEVCGLLREAKDSIAVAQDTIESEIPDGAFSWRCPCESLQAAAPVAATALIQEGSD